MTSAARAATPPSASGPRPLVLTVAAILLWVTAGLTVLLPLSQFSDSTFIGCSVAVGSATPSPSGSVTSGASSSAAASSSPTPSSGTTPSLSRSEQADLLRDCVAGSGTVRPDTSDLGGLLGRVVLQSALIPVVVMVALGLFVWRGTPVVRWFVLGIWVVSNLVPIASFPLLSTVGSISTSYLPVLVKVVLGLGFVTFTAATVLVNLRPAVAYFNERRPVRTVATRPAGGGLFGGMFGPRQSPPPTNGAGGGVSMSKPPTSGTNATTRPARSKGRAAGNDGPGPTSGPAGGGPGRSRGKSRRS